MLGGIWPMHCKFACRYSETHGELPDFLHCTIAYKKDIPQMFSIISQRQALER